MDCFLNVSAFLSSESQFESMPCVPDDILRLALNDVIAGSAWASSDPTSHSPTFSQLPPLSHSPLSATSFDLEFDMTAMHDSLAWATQPAIVAPCSSLDLYNGTSLEATALEPIKEDALMLFQPESSSSATMASRHHSGRSLPTSSWDEPNSKARLTSLSRTNPNFEDAPIDSDSDDDRGDGDASDTTSDEHISDTALRTKASARLPSSFQVAPDYSDSEGERDMDAEGDMDAEYHSAFDAACTISESDSDDEDDKDYDPRGASSSKGKTAPTTPPRRTSTIHSHRFSPYRSPNTTPSRAGSAPTSPTPSNASPARLRVFPTRVEQVSSSMPAPSPSDLHPSPNPRDSDRPWECDHCDYASKRRSELARHTRAHLQGEREAEHACWGVPVEQAAEFGITDLRDAMVFNGELRVGGCWKRFSRRDAVLRHLKAKNNYCVCDIYPAKVLKAR